VLSQLRSLDIVKIIGGEPFQRDDLGEIVATIRQRIDPFVLQLVTNGTDTGRIVRFMERHAWPNLHLRLSLDGLEGAHDEARGAPGTFERVMTTMRELAALRETRPFQLGVNFILDDESFGDMTELARLCRRHDVDLIPGFAVRPFLRHSDLADEEVATVRLQRPQRALERLGQRDHGAVQGFSRAERLLLRAVNARVFRKQVQGGDALRFRCRELRSLMYLLPNGDLVTCGLNHEPIGNLARESFRTVWYRQETEPFRQRVDRCSGCMQGAVEILSKAYGG